MRVVILAGGLGSRLQEETIVRPKPMIEIGGKPILWHIMKQYSHFGFHEFVIALGYLGESIKQYFLDWYQLSGQLTIDFSSGEIHRDQREFEPWKIHAINTGRTTLTGGRILRLQSLLEDQTFMVTYGDGVANIDIEKLLDFHRSQNVLATVTAVRPPARFGGMVLEGDRVSQFSEKPQTGEGWINGGFLVFEPGVFEYLKDDRTSLEADGLERLAAEGQLAVYRHDDFWQCMDTLRDKNYLENLWQQGRAPWKMWA